MSRRVIFLGSLLASLVSAIAAPPAWWALRSVTDANPPNDDAAVNQGQLKQFTQKAVQELNARIPGGAGEELNSLVAGWVQAYQNGNYNATNPLPADFEAMTSGQLKWIASKVHARLVFAKYETAPPAWLVPNPAIDSQLVNLGQLKTVFNFDLTAPTGQLPEWWQKFYFNGQTGIDPNDNPDNDGLTNVQELTLGTNPTSPDSDGDGIPDNQDPFPNVAATGQIPVITFISPLNNSSLASSHVLVQASALADRQILSVRINSVLAAVDDEIQNQYEAGINLFRGLQKITVRVETIEGRVKEEFITVNVPSEPADVLVLSPSETDLISNQNVRVICRATSDTATVEINGVVASQDGYFFYSWVRLSAGTNAINVAVFSNGIETGSDSVTVTYSPPPGYDPDGDDDQDSVSNKHDLFPNDSLESTDQDGDGTGDNDDSDPIDPTTQTIIRITAPKNGEVIYAK